jgi:hypothetical protein
MGLQDMPQSLVTAVTERQTNIGETPVVNMVRGR